MKTISVLMCGIVAMSLVSAAVWRRKMRHLSPPPCDCAVGQVTITVSRRSAANLAILHGNPGVDTNHPDASGGRVAVLYGLTVS